MAGKKGVTLYVGDLGESEAQKAAEASGPDTGPLDVTSRLVAHIAHRIPGIKKIEKRFEGQDKSAGIGSDFMALFANLYEKNETLINETIADVLSGKGITIPIPVRDAETSPQDDGVVDFGAVSPVVVNNDHERSTDNA